MGRKWENRADPHWSDVDMGSRMTPTHPVTEDHRDGCQELLGAAVLLDPHQQLSHTGTAARHQPDRTLLPTCFRLKLDAHLRAASPASSQTTSPSMLHALGGAGRQPAASNGRERCWDVGAGAGGSLESRGQCGNFGRRGRSGGWAWGAEEVLGAAAASGGAAFPSAFYFIFFRLRALGRLPVSLSACPASSAVLAGCGRALPFPL